MAGAAENCAALLDDCIIVRTLGKASAAILPDSIALTYHCESNKSEPPRDPDDEKRIAKIAAPKDERIVPKSPLSGPGADWSRRCYCWYCQRVVLCANGRTIYTRCEQEPHSHMSAKPH